MWFFQFIRIKSNLCKGHNIADHCLNLEKYLHFSELVFSEQNIYPGCFHSVCFAGDRQWIQIWFYRITLSTFSTYWSQWYISWMIEYKIELQRLWFHLHSGNSASNINRLTSIRQNSERAMGNINGVTRCDILILVCHGCERSGTSLGWPPPYIFRCSRCGEQMFVMSVQVRSNHIELWTISCSLYKKWSLFQSFSAIW